MKSKFKEFLNFAMKNAVLFFGIFLLMMNLIAFSAPILAHFGLEKIAHPIYVIYGAFCHQRPWRSIHLFDFQVAWCTRDTFIYIGMSLAAFFVHFFNLRKVRWYLPIICIIPFALDGTTQLIAEIVGVMHNGKEFFYASTNFLRMLTGSVFGAGVGLWMFSLLNDVMITEYNLAKALRVKIKGKFADIKLFIVVIAISFVIYLGLIQLWRVTSPIYGPKGLLDNVRNFPGVNYEETDRRGHAV